MGNSRDKTVAEIPLDLDRALFLNVGYLVRRTLQIADALFEREMKGLGLTPVQYGILIAVSAFEGIDQFQVGQMIGHDRTTISYVVRKLVGKKLIRRFKEAKDRRSNLLALTEEGVALLREARPLARTTMRNLLEELSADEQATLQRLLNKIVHAHDAQATIPRITPSRRAARRAGRRG